MASDPISQESSQIILSSTEIINKLRQHYRFDSTPGGLEWAMSTKLEIYVASWHEWFTKNHARDWPAGIVNNKKSNIDFRIFFLAFPVAGAHFLRVVEACYDIDMALCGTSQAALEKIKQWRDMDQFCYLKRRDIILWWEAEFTQLRRDFDSDIRNSLVNSLRVEKVEAAVSKLMGALPEFRNSVDYSFKWTESGYLRTMVFDRERIVSKHMESIREIVRLACKRSPATGLEVHAIILDIQEINKGELSSAVKHQYIKNASRNIRSNARHRLRAPSFKSSF